MRHLIFFRVILSAGFTLVLNSGVFAVTAADYANAGLQLYNQKNYAQAIQYYSAALSLDPTNTAALQGRANCYYTQGQYQQALDDYQKVQAIAPSPQLSQFIQSLQAKVGTAVPPLPGAPATGGSFDQGVALYQQKQYAAAIPLFQQAGRENPNDSKAFYYLGLSYLMTGNNKDATLNLAISNKKQPNPSVEAYANQLKARLSPDDQQWVDGQLAASGVASGALIGASLTPKKFGIRLEPAVLLLGLNDFTNNAQNWQSAATSQQASDPTVAFSAHVPTLCADIAVEPVLKLSPNFELGLPFAIIPVGTADDLFSSSNSAVTLSDSFQISGISIGLNARYLIGTGSFQPYVGGGLLVVPMSITYSLNYNYSGTQIEGNGNFSSLGIGGQVELGLDWHLGDTFVITPFGGYQLASANNFTGNLSATSQYASGSTNATLSVVPFPPYGKVIVPVASGASFAGYNAPAGTAPLTVDLSGVKGGIEISAFF